ncbi:hypothetical protein A2165_02365 [Candidatus Curtissbacteria bacterium RBG_13_40_7]|uniref:HD/PDEase domain-containing protein n=1 Tax=Candidatus Curtissbacteria bacterium RBG_13_40_7 TaxID=1797706 RepID=A0A1F5FUX3_9BACT|nr:MAG: hypothetical protein A2165_02365 [Candidatus Curtissbacteria bacterium RBG_13_40_7]
MSESISPSATELLSEKEILHAREIFSDDPIVLKALEFAIKAHSGQTRKAGGESYIIHPIGVAIMVRGVGADSKTQAAALLHDVPEDTSFSLEDIRENFGNDIANMVEDVTEDDKTKLWMQRKYEGIERVTQLGKNSLLIKTANAVYNYCTLIHGLEQKGEEFMKPFNAPLPAQVDVVRRLYEALVAKWPENPWLHSYRTILESLEDFDDRFKFRSN